MPPLVSITLGQSFFFSVTASESRLHLLTSLIQNQSGTVVRYHGDSPRLPRLPCLLICCCQSQQNDHCLLLLGCGGNANSQELRELTLPQKSSCKSKTQQLWHKREKGVIMLCYFWKSLNTEWNSILVEDEMCISPRDTKADILPDKMTLFFIWPSWNLRDCLPLQMFWLSRDNKFSFTGSL